MKTIEILAEALKMKIISGVPVKFESVPLKRGGRAIVAINTQNGERYIINASLNNFDRFKEWEGKLASADLQPLRKKERIADGDNLRLTNIRTTVKLSKEEESETNTIQDVLKKTTKPKEDFVV